jgi:GntR family transcriptional regulator, transcriptional repressor for pyruvate dehydrogenase complex
MTRAAVRLEQLRSLPLKEQVLRQLRRLIDEGELGPGDQLPAERELADRLGVSRGTVREAVQFLQALGLVEIRHGSGTFVRRAPSDRDGLRDEWRRWTRLHSETIRNIIEVRMGLESFAAELAAGRPTEPGLDAMAAALDQMEEAARANDVAALVRSDVAFHRGLCEAAGNPALAELAEELGSRLLQERAATWDLPGRPERSLAEHREIHDAVRARDPSRARAAVLSHLSSVQDDVEGFLAGPRREGS